MGNKKQVERKNKRAIKNAIKLSRGKSVRQLNRTYATYFLVGYTEMM